ncbi:dynein axonemal assembly factor 4-like [Dysidea avara]|uniref:dynein axonemal assembly factor 4-like n=1 Tax=Dysidea avara TaxID=196820 RepID=UPI00332208DB
MPVLVKDYTWSETDTEVLITVPLKGVKPSKADIFSSEDYVKINYTPYLFEVFLYAPVVEEESSIRVGNGVVEMRLCKKEKVIWGQLESNIKMDKEEMRRKREDVVKAVQEKMEQEQMERATKKREAEKLAIKQQMQLEEEAHSKIEKEKQDERDKAMEELEEWKQHKQEETKTTSITNKPTIQPAQLKQQQNSKLSHNMWQDNKDIPDSQRPAPRSGGKITVNFTPRYFPTAARESTEKEEQEWLAKMAAARKIQAGTPSEINKNNPMLLKDKACGFFKAGDYEAAINAFSQAISLNPMLPVLYSNRAACYLKLNDNEKCIQDATRALELLYPVVPSNHIQRAKVFVRRGTAYANIGNHGLALQDYEAAEKLDPDNTQLQTDIVQIRNLISCDS